METCLRHERRSLFERCAAFESSESFLAAQLAITAGDIVHGKRIDMPPRGGLPQYQAAPRAKRGWQARLGEA